MAENELGATLGPSHVAALDMLEGAMVQQASEAAAARTRARYAGPHAPSGLPGFLGGVGQRALDIVKFPGEAMKNGLTTEAALPWGREVALNMLGVGGPAAMVAGEGRLGVAGGKPGIVHGPEMGTGAEAPKLSPLPVNFDNLEKEIKDIMDSIPEKAPAKESMIPLGKPSFDDYVKANPGVPGDHPGAESINSENAKYLDYIKEHFPEDYAGEVKIEAKMAEKAAKPKPTEGGELKLVPAEGEMSIPGDHFIHDASGKKVGEITALDDGNFHLGTKGESKVVSSVEEALKAAQELHNAPPVPVAPSPVAKAAAKVKEEDHSDYANPVQKIHKGEPLYNSQFPLVNEDMAHFQPSSMVEADRQADRVAGGYTTEAYRGVSQPSRQFPSIRGKSSGGTTGNEYFSTESARLADMYAREYRTGPNQHPNIQPLALDTRDYLTYDAGGQSWSEVNDQAVAQARKEGKKGIIMQNVLDEPHSTNKLGPQQVYITLDPGTLRSKFARFHPDKWGKNDLLGSFAGGSVIAGNALLGKEEK